MNSPAISDTHAQAIRDVNQAVLDQFMRDVHTNPPGKKRALYLIREDGRGLISVDPEEYIKQHQEKKP